MGDEFCERLNPSDVPSYSFSAQSNRHWPAPGVSNFGLKFAARLNSLWTRWLGVRSAISTGVSVMGTEHLPRKKAGRFGEPSLWGDEHDDEMHTPLDKITVRGDESSFRGDEHSGDLHSLLEENARLRGLLVKLSGLVLKNVVRSR
jgi:hypothetical protein